MTGNEKRKGERERDGGSFRNGRRRKKEAKQEIVKLQRKESPF